jgi:sulfur-carrier protein adenylyltransferase/sulfurtransferase
MLGQKMGVEISAIELDDLMQDGADILLLDVREPSEYEICNLKGKLIPLKELQDRIAELDKHKHIVVHCKHGGRSLQAVKLLKTHGFNHVSNLTGGIMAWIDEIDPTMLRY